MCLPLDLAAPGIADFRQSCNRIVYEFLQGIRISSPQPTLAPESIHVISEAIFVSIARTSGITLENTHRKIIIDTLKSAVISK
jgi:hypothetical protein